MSEPRFTAADLRIVPLSECSPRELGLLSVHVATQYPRDGKTHPENSLEWLFLHGLPHCRLAQYHYQPPHQIYVAFNGSSEQILDIAGVVPDDRNVAKQLKLREREIRTISAFSAVTAFIPIFADVVSAH